MLSAQTYEEALERNREITGKGISIQAWNLVPQIRQVRNVVHPSDTDQFVECHPESSFAAMTENTLFSRKQNKGLSNVWNSVRSSFLILKVFCALFLKNAKWMTHWMPLQLLGQQRDTFGANPS